MLCDTKHDFPSFFEAFQEASPLMLWILAELSRLRQKPLLEGFPWFPAQYLPRLPKFQLGGVGFFFVFFSNLTLLKVM